MDVRNEDENYMSAESDRSQFSILPVPWGNTEGRGGWRRQWCDRVHKRGTPSQSMNGDAQPEGARIPTNRKKVQTVLQKVRYYGFALWCILCWVHRRRERSRTRHCFADHLHPRGVLCMIWRSRNEENIHGQRSAEKTRGENENIPLI